MQTVTSGPFKGMKLLPDQPWDDGNLNHKLDGSYEGELHACVDRIIELNPKRIINVGCAEGYYAVGLGLRLPDTEVIAVDRNQNCLNVCLKNAELNGVKLLNCGEITAPILSIMIEGNTVVVMDCEGGELDLINPFTCPNLPKAVFLIECHDFMHPNTSSILLDRLLNTHTVKVIRNAHLDIRPLESNWLFAEPK